MSTINFRVWQVAFGKDGFWQDEAAGLSGVIVEDGVDAEIFRQPETAAQEALVDVEMRVADEQDARAVPFRLLADLAEAVGTISCVFDHQVIRDDLDGSFGDVRKEWLDVAEAAAHHLRPLLVDERAIEDDRSPVRLLGNLHERSADEVLLECRW